MQADVQALYVAEFQTLPQTKSLAEVLGWVEVLLFNLIFQMQTQRNLLLQSYRVAAAEAASVAVAWQADCKRLTKLIDGRSLILRLMSQVGTDSFVLTRAWC